MPLGVKPVCTKCKTKDSTMWRKSDRGEVLCNSCVSGNLPEKEISVEEEEMDDDVQMTSGGAGQSRTTSQASSFHRQVSVNNGNNSLSGPMRKSARIKPGRGRPSGSTKNVTTKGKSRRAIFKKNPIRSPASVSTVLTTEFVFHNNTYYQAGDIVSLLDHDRHVYYAQIRGFMQDQFLEKSAVITWLIPTQYCTQEKFDPAAYILGPEEDLPRKLDYMEFVCHAPSDYYKTTKTPYPTPDIGPELCYIWTAVGADCIRTYPNSRDEIFGPYQEEEKEKIKIPRDKSEKKSKSSGEKHINVQDS